jgi:TRAP-type C4-dicarboxylate transport system substrate-binding protein
MVANVGAWNKLPVLLQNMVIDEFEAAGNTASIAMFDAETSLEEKLKSQGVAINKPASDPFRKAIADAGLYKTWRDQYGPDVWKLLENATGRLT